MPRAERSVLHVLPHPGGGGETYVDVLSGMPGYRFTRTYLAPGPSPREAAPALIKTAPRANLAAREHDVLHVHGEAASLLCLPSLATRPSVVTLHGLNLLRRAHGVGRWAAVANLRLILRTAGRTVCVSRSEYEEVIDAVGRTAAKRAVIIHNGVELPQLPSDDARRLARTELGLSADRIVGIWVGAIEEFKDPLSPALAAVDVANTGLPFTLLVAGDGPMRADVERVAGERDGSVIVLGFRHDIRLLLGAADFFVLSSQREGLPFSLLEAMSMGLPAIVAGIPGAREAVGDTGVIVTPGDVKGFANAFIHLSTDSAARDRLGRSARERIDRQFRADQMIDRLRDVYEDVLEERQPRRRPLPTAQ